MRYLLKEIAMNDFVCSYILSEEEFAMHISPSYTEMFKIIHTKYL